MLHELAATGSCEQCNKQKQILVFKHDHSFQGFHYQLFFGYSSHLADIARACEEKAAYTRQKRSLFIIF